MLTSCPPSWYLPEHCATDETVFHNRRRIIKTLGLGTALLPAAGLIAPLARAAAPSPSADLYPAKRNSSYALDRPLTDEKHALNYVNFYEFGSSKDVAPLAQSLEIAPWQLRIDGLVEQEITVDAHDLIRKMPLEERLYRHRCVEAWSMAVPWSGFAMKALLDFAKPLSSARYVVMETLADEETMPGLSAFWYPWPYVEGLTIEEATNELAFIGTGIYGKAMPKQNGAPIRLVVPWKYGFKSIKSINRITFSDQRPKSFWEQIQGREYGFWANVNPEVSHPRWSQASERVLGTNERVPTLLYNGYGDQVAHLYTGLKDERLFM
ncbi:protein-methionine-sulfoxide reductase catalytic subunit MsrP [Aestuariispira insulae]|uniref:Protein-methionine-sulfoxide reductase catalytic subunit MsrP n=1 Tax=Aestuariispira insulae TaxID=1461337 RepID=A0A3D9HY44_9PROT|nr:protein-methionine-sulfoxide reductase catalytic subunit MsrP [Aestuariispira insulae]RED54340.1 sulfoxide reductase catalytic subunit YedY [Aestuariispira insulae]